MRHTRPGSKLARGAAAAAAGLLAAAALASPAIAAPTAVPAGVTVERISGADRYATAVAISQRAYPGKADVVYLATGENFPDALSAGPAAAKQGGPVLLTHGGSLPANVKAEIERLDPDKVVVVGGTNSVPGSVVTELQNLARNPVRVAGPDRYATSRAIIDYAFAGGDDIHHNYIATGAGFADALSAGSAAGAHRGAVMLLPGLAGTVDDASLSIVAKANTNATVSGHGPNLVVGGTAVISEATYDALKVSAPSPNLQRLSGPDRYATSFEVNLDQTVNGDFGVSDLVVLATGLNFPDALAASAWAGHEVAPLYIVPGNCVPTVVIDMISGQGATKVVLVGGSAALTSAVETLTPC